MQCLPFAASRCFRRTAWLLALALGLAVATSACSVPSQRLAASTSVTGHPQTRRNIIFVLADDLSMDLVQYMPHVLALQKAGTTFGNYTVTDSLCCPSRSSIFTGKFPHNTGIFTNSAPDGGFGVFHSRGEEAATFATALQGSGYRTAMMGKYLNGYQPSESGDRTNVPPGWDEWDVAGNGYEEFNYNLSENGHVVHYGATPQDYLTDVLSGKGQSFIRASAAAHVPFLLETATFAPHSPYTPAPEDANAFPGMLAPRGPAFNVLPTDPPPWLAGRSPLPRGQIANLDVIYRKRVQAVQALDRMVGALQQTAVSAGIAGNTDIVFSSDNGYHIGEYQLNPGKMTAFDTDVRVPLVAAGPGIAAGRTRAEPVQNIDLAPTFEQIAGADIGDVDGRSLTPLLAGRSGGGWRTAALVEHHGPDVNPTDPDLPGKGSGNPPSYEALRTASSTYVEYVDGSKEFYDRASDPYELHNTVAALSSTALAALHAQLTALSACQGQDPCWRAAHLPR